MAAATVEQTCLLYQRGRCQHIDPNTECPHGVHPTKACATFFQTGYCQYGGFCKFSHPPTKTCVHWLLDQCTKGDKCTFQHYYPRGSEVIVPPPKGHDISKGATWACDECGREKCAFIHFTESFCSAECMGNYYDDEFEQEEVFFCEGCHRSRDMPGFCSDACAEGFHLRGDGASLFVQNCLQCGEESTETFCSQECFDKSAAPRCRCGNECTEGLSGGDYDEPLCRECHDYEVQCQYRQPVCGEDGVVCAECQEGQIAV
jgi:hypothetical protein